MAYGTDTDATKKVSGYGTGRRTGYGTGHDYRHDSLGIDTDADSIRHRHDSIRHHALCEAVAIDGIWQRENRHGTEN